MYGRVFTWKMERIINGGTIVLKQEIHLTEVVSFCSACALYFLDWSEIVQSYVNANRNDAVPCTENAVSTKAQVENTKASNDVVQLCADMDAVELPTENHENHDVRSAGEKRAIEYLKTCSIFDSDEHVLNDIFVSRQYFTLCIHLL